MKKSTIFCLALAAAAAFAGASCSSKAADKAEAEATVETDTLPTVYYIKDITPENVVKIYNALGRKAEGKVGIKISTGESNKSNHLDTALINDLVRLVNGTFIECNTAYNGNRMDTETHRRAAEEHGFVGVDIMDADGTIELPVEGKHLKKDIVGKNLENYDFIIVLSHFKGHAMGGFGGALKNISIGLASSHGKAYIHGAGDPAEIWTAEHDAFLESMADASKTIMEYYKDKIAFINVMKNMSVDCDCCAVAEDPAIQDIGILASLDPVALDQACLDLVYACDDPGKPHFLERVESRNGVHTVETAEQIGVGSRKYELIEL